MVQVQLNNAVPSDWNERVIAVNGTVFHSREWSDYLAAYPSAPQPVVFQGTGGVALGMLSRSRLGLGSKLHFSALPSVAEGVSITEFVAAIEKAARAHGVSLCRFESFDSPAVPGLFDSASYCTHRRLEFLVPLAERSEEEILKGLETIRRRNIKAAAKKGVEAAEESSVAGLAILLELQRASSKRAIERGGPDFSSSIAAEQHPARVLIKSGVGRLFVARREGKPLSAALFTSFNRQAYFVLAGHSDEALQYQSGTLLMWEALRQLKKEGAASLNLGGCAASAAEESSPEHGVYLYKKLFGGSMIECVNGERVLRPVAFAAETLIRRITGRG